MATYRRRVAGALVGTVLCLTGLIGSGGDGLAADAELIDTCQQCHGADSVSRWPDIPRIAGLPEVVVANALYDFRGRARPCRKPTCGASGACIDVDMCEIAAGLSAEQIDALARRYAARSFTAVTGEFDAALAARGAVLHEDHCEDCHTAGGSDPLDQASILRGQSSTYLRNAIEDYRSLRREGEAPMLRAFERIDDQEIEALLHFYMSPAP